MSLVFQHLNQADDDISSDCCFADVLANVLESTLYLDLHDACEHAPDVRQRNARLTSVNPIDLLRDVVYVHGRAEHMPSVCDSLL